MPTYGGGKALIGKRIAKRILEIKEIIGYDSEYYLEPFCGLYSVGRHMRFPVRLANDMNEDLILLLQSIQKGWIPPNKPCSKKLYDKYRISDRHSAKKGFYGIGCAYSGIFFAGYRTTNGTRNFFQTFRKGLLDLRDDIEEVEFSSGSYLQFNPEGMIIYCDPPYENNNFGGEYFSNFDHKHFWNVMREWSKNNLVFISEYVCPEKDFFCVWEQQYKSSFTSGDRKNRIEKLFMYKKSLNIKNFDKLVL